MNYFLLLKRARGIVLLYLFIVHGEEVCLDLFIFNSFTLEGEGVKVDVFFFLIHLTCGRRRGKGLIFFFKTFFSLLGG